MSSINVGGLIMTARKKRFRSTREAAAAVRLNDARGSRSLSGEGLRKYEKGLSLPSANVLSALIQGWEMGGEEAGALWNAVHVARERRDGFEPRKDAIKGENMEAAVASAVGEMVSECRILVEGMVDDVDDQEAFLGEVRAISNRIIRSHFR
jgi:hypothetical protein